MPFTETSGAKIHYAVEGSGPPLLLGHGFTGSIAMWQTAPFYGELKSQFTVIPFDARGHGKSDKPHDSSAYSMENRVQDAVAVLQAAGFESGRYFGYSMGGWLGYLLALHAGERFDRIVVGAAHMLFDDWSDRRRMLSLGIDGYIKEMLEQDPATPQENIDKMRANDLEALLAVQFDRPDLTSEIPSITSDLLIYAGDEDPKYNKFKKTSELIQGARFITIPGADHAGGFQQTGEALVEILAFLKA